MSKKPSAFIPKSRWVKYKDGYWIPVRKRNYLYWYKFLQIAEQSPDYKVDWKKYKGWGNANVILGTPFDSWWNENWIKLFGIKKEGDTPKFPLSTKQPKTDSYRYALLVYENKDVGSNWEIAVKIVKRENKKRGLGMTGNSHLFFADEPDKIGAEDKMIIQSRIGRYKQQGKKILTNVSVGVFP